MVSEELRGDARARERASSAQKQVDDVQNIVRGSPPAGVDANHRPQNQAVENPVGELSRKLRETAEAARSAQQQPAPSAQRPASDKRSAAKVEETCPGHPNILRSSPTCTAAGEADAARAAKAKAADRAAAASTGEAAKAAKEEEPCPGHPNIRRSSPTCQAAAEADERRQAVSTSEAAEAATPPSADTGLRSASMTDELKPVGMSHCTASDTGPIKVAVLIAMDIRLPKGGGHCTHPGDITCDSREDVLKLLNGITT